MATTASVSVSLARCPAPAVQGAKRSAFCAGAARLAAPRAATGALLSARRQAAVVEARGAKTSAAGQQVTVDVEKPLGLVNPWLGDCWRGSTGLLVDWSWPERHCPVALRSEFWCAI